MTDPKPSTNDILAKIRGASGGAPKDDAPAVEASGAGAAPEAPAPAPSSTADILAAARAKAAPASAGGSPLDKIRAAGAGGAASGGAAPKSPSDIMAAIRGGAAAKPAAAKSADSESEGAGSPAPAKAVPAGLSPAEMIRKAREVSAGGEVKPPVALPSRPLPAKASSAAVPRRGVLADFLAVLCTPVVVAWVAFSGAALTAVAGVARFMMPNVLVEPPTRFKIGPPNDYAPGAVSTKWQAQFGVWIVNAEVDGAQQIYALSTVCTHLGCTPNWLEGEQKFKCPCHGSGFYKSGVNFEGPAPRPLERFGLRLAEDGMLEVDKGLKFQKELGQWSNPSCFVPVG
ncbi:MAG: ubiquinol-cytochrome c reductase iron-sulfur subunit [Planctomycetaceae bacterium]